jgi:hypothetical protein
MVSRLTQEARNVNICMRCGVVDDFRSGSDIRAASVAFPETVVPGASLHVSMEIHCAATLRECVALAGISGPYSPKVAPQAVRADVRQCVAHVAFVFHLPRSIPLHEFRWKCIIAGDEDVAFLTRRFFVVEQCQRTDGTQLEG